MWGKYSVGSVDSITGNLQCRTDNAMVQTFGVNSLNELTNVTRSGTLTVAGATSTNASSVTVNGSSACHPVWHPPSW